jgi:hypothetical protein
LAPEMNNDASVSPASDALVSVTSPSLDILNTASSDLRPRTISARSEQLGYSYDPLQSLRDEMYRIQELTPESLRISGVNEKYDLCSTYPPLLLVPSRASDTLLLACSKVRLRTARYLEKFDLPRMDSNYCCEYFLSCGFRLVYFYYFICIDSLL